MLRIIGDKSIFESKAQALVNPVNLLGISGAGLAKEFAWRFPDNQKAMKNRARSSPIWKPGEVFVHRNLEGSPDYIINFPTKRHWRDDSRMEDIKDGLKNLVSAMEDFDIESAAIPALGCGLGGLEWYAVQGEIYAAFKGMPYNVELYAPRT